MPRWLRVLRARLPRGLILWVVLCALLTVGMATTVADLLRKTPITERTYATRHGQRVTVHPVTGSVYGLMQTPEDADLVEAEEPAAEDAKNKEEKHADDDTADTAVPSTETAAEDTPSTSDLPRLRTEPIRVAPLKIPSNQSSIIQPPAPEVTELINGITLPKRGNNHSSPASIYANSFTADHEKDQAYLSIVIIDAGFNTQTLEMITKLPREVTVAFSPYAIALGPHISALHSAGYETWSMLPTMGANYPQDDPGPLGLIASLPGPELLQRLHRIMARTLGSVGFILPADEALSDHAGILNPLLKEIDTRGLYLLSTHPTRNLDQLTPDKRLQAHARRSDEALDANASTPALQSKLAGLPDLARNHGALIVVIPARPHMLQLLTQWLNTHPLGDDVVLTPLSFQYEDHNAPKAMPKAASSGGHGGATKPSGGGH